MDEFRTWLASQSPGWIFMILPLLFVSIALVGRRDHRKQKKLEANPMDMTSGQYQDFNNKRMKR